MYIVFDVLDGLKYFFIYMFSVAFMIFAVDKLFKLPKELFRKLIHFVSFSSVIIMIYAAKEWIAAAMSFVAFGLASLILVGDIPFSNCLVAVIIAAPLAAITELVTKGGLAGCESAIHLGMEGKRVHLVEMRDELAPDANVRHRPLLLKEIDKYVTVHTGFKGLEVTKDGILCKDKNGEKQLVHGPSVICALGQRSRTAYNGAKIARVCSRTDTQRAISLKRIEQFGLISKVDY